MAISAPALRHARDIQAVFASGMVAHGRAVVLHANRRDDAGPARWAVVAGRKVGGAVRRNRAKRRLRAVLTAAELPAGLDVVAVARQPALSCPSGELRAEVVRLLQRLQGVGASVGGAA